MLASFLKNDMRKRCILIGVLLIYWMQIASSDTNDEKLCMDTDPNCRDWALAAECRRDGSYKYMKTNCPFSCNYCNPNFKKWIPLDIHAGEHSKSALTKKYNRVPIYHGVPQASELSAIYDAKVQQAYIVINGGMQMAEYHQIRVNDVVNLMNAYLDSIYTDEVAFVSGTGQQVDDGTPFATLMDYSPVDIEAAPLNARLPVPESCINKHTNCGLWATLGYCDSSRKMMSHICSPMCHSCDTNIPTPDGVAYQEASWVTSPFYRHDLAGIFDSLTERRVVVHSDNNNNMDQHNANGYLDYFPPNMKLDYKNIGRMNESQFLNMDTIKIDALKFKRNEIDQERYRKALQSEESGTVVSNVVAMHDLLSKEDCQGLRDTVAFGIGVDRTKFDNETGEDGFPIRTIDVGKTDDGTPVIKRSSSRVFIFPSIKDNDGAMKYSNAIERLLIKVNLLTGMNAGERIEAPIIFEKHEVGDIHHSSTHFQSGLLTKEIEYIDYDDLGVTHGHHYGIEDEIDKMENARIFGITIFLSGDGSPQAGGEMYFPKMMNAKFYPKEGTAILFPTVASLVGQNDYDDCDDDDDDDDGDGCSATGALDEHIDHSGEDSSFLVEDQYTSFGHAPVKEGVKYSFTLYFRRYEDYDRLPE